MQLAITAEVDIVTGHHGEISKHFDDFIYATYSQGAGVGAKTAQKRTIATLSRILTSYSSLKVKLDKVEQKEHSGSIFNAGCPAKQSF